MGSDGVEDVAYITYSEGPRVSWPLAGGKRSPPAAPASTARGAAHKAIICSTRARQTELHRMPRARQFGPHERGSATQRQPALRCRDVAYWVRSVRVLRLLLGQIAPGRVR